MTSSSFRLRDVLWLPRIVGVLAVVALGGRRLPLPRLARLLDGSGCGSRRRRDAAEADRLVRLTQALLLRLYQHDFCYPRSLVLFHFLTRWGRPAQLRFGIRRDDDCLAGHAWIELDGTPFAEAQDPRAHYAATFTYPSTQPRLRHEPTHTRSPHRNAAQAVRRADPGAAREAA